MNGFKNFKSKKEYFESFVNDRTIFRIKNSYYHQLNKNYIKFLVPENSSVVDIGCFSGDILDSLKPKRGLGIDFSKKSIEKAAIDYPHLRFQVSEIDHIDIEEKFDYIIVDNIIGYANDLQTAIRQIKKMCSPNSKIIFLYHSQVWRPILRLAELLGLRTKWPEQHWLSTKDLINLFYLEDLTVVRRAQQVLFPIYIPFISTLFNKIIVHLPFFRNFALNHVFVVQKNEKRMEEENASCTVLVPCRNEKGNIEAAVTRLPPIGKHTEIIFVEGHSKDGTLEECYRVKEAYPDKDIKVMVQKGKGKGNAVREGFEAATCDVLMILDADLTVAPEVLPEFFSALVSGKGEFINGSRLVYEMENEAMRFLNMLANKTFSIILTHLLGQYLKDTLCGTKVLFREDYLKIQEGRKYFGDFDPFGDFDLLFGAAKLNLKIVEIPVHYHARTYGETQISRFRHGWQLLKMVVFAARKIKYV